MTFPELRSSLPGVRCWCLATFLMVCRSIGIGQEFGMLVTINDADSNFVRKFRLPNDCRVFYGMQGNNLSVGSMSEDVARINSDIYRNTNDYIGVGLSYGWFDGDLCFSIPGTTYLKQDRSNLQQFKTALGYSRRKMVFRWYFSDNKGVVMSSSENNHETAPTLHEIVVGMQTIFIMQPERFSYRASMYQSEFQIKTGGSMLLKLEPFFRDLGTKEGSVFPETYDAFSRLGNQTGLQYLKATGILFLPGYGINIVIPKTGYFISPIVYAGAGAARNFFKAKSGDGSFNSIEYSGIVSLNAGYNGNRAYFKLLVSSTASYALLDRAYLTNANVNIMLMMGLRFMVKRSPFAISNK